MKLLMENWRQYLNEGIDPRIQKQIDKLLSPGHSDLSIAIVGNPEQPGKWYEILYVRVTNPETEEWAMIRRNHMRLPRGRVIIGRINPDKYGHCFGGYVVSGASATHGWGPLLYDVALEWASQKSSGLASDRMSLSPHAQAVWSKYEKRRDVDNDQMDYFSTEDIRKTYYGREIEKLTPDDTQDDCLQNVSIEVGGEHGWMDTPFSKIYKKDSNEVMQALKSAGRLIVENK